MSEVVSIQINWYTSDLTMHVLGASDELLTKLALYAEGAFKVAARVDTGFYRNSAYVIGPFGADKGKTWADGEYKSQKTGQMEMRRSVASEPSVPAHVAAVHVAAEYAIYRELEDSTLYNAAEAARALMDTGTTAVSWEGR